MRGLVLPVALAAMALASCKFSVDPDKAKFNCASDTDCGSGHVCVTQMLTGNGVCFAAGACQPETCNGLDDDCDGVVDNNIAAVGTACTSTAAVCAAGLQACEGGRLLCVGQVLKQPEACDGVTDRDCNGKVGCADPACVGTAACGPGCACRADGGTREVDCGDGVDNNGNGLIDCADPDCLSLACDGDAGLCAYTGTPVPTHPDGGHFHPGFHLLLDGGLEDGGRLPDAGEPADAGAADAGELDAGLATDAGRIVDGGSAADAGARPDAGADAGVEDAGPTDAGVFCAIPSSICPGPSCP